MPPEPPGSANRIVTARFRGRWRDLPPVALPPVAAVVTEDHLAALTAAWAYAREPGGEVLLLATTQADETARRELLQGGFAVLDRSGRTGPAWVRPADPGRIWVHTSGTTGRPKRAGYHLAGLKTSRAAAMPPRRWLFLFAIGSYAWWQMVGLSLALPGQDLVAIEPADLADWPQIAAAEQVNAVSGTPTFWRHSLLRAGPQLRGLRLDKVALSGEPVDQPLLDGLRQAFPGARITWAYGSAEVGLPIVVHDGRAGFPVGWLEGNAAGRPRIELEAGELLIHSRDGRVLRTGDRAEITGDRVMITGRIDQEEINVGGAKTRSSAVRGVLICHPAVAWAAVRPIAAPLVGQLVAADIVLRSPADRRELIAWCAARLPYHAVPRRLQILEEIPMTNALKSHV